MLIHFLIHFLIQQSRDLERTGGEIMQAEFSVTTTP